MKNAQSVFSDSGLQINTKYLCKYFLTIFITIIILYEIVFVVVTEKYMNIQVINVRFRV